MSLPLIGKWTVTKSSNIAAFVLLPNTSSLHITETGDNYAINSLSARFEDVSRGGKIRRTPQMVTTAYTWSINYTSQDRGTICGQINQGEYCFVITVGGQGKQRGVHGIIYSGDLSDGQDPGTWEADEEGGGTDG